MKRLLTPFILALALLAPPLGAQETADDDRGFLENWLERNLSAAGREVRVEGFAGALSARATMEAITIADDEGVWFTLRGAELDWTRSALLAGRLEVERITAREIEIARRPVAISDGPQAEASDFALPELPVSVRIGSISAERVVLGEGVLGTAAVVRLDGSARLASGEGDARLALERIDGAEGRLRLAGTFSNETRRLTLDLALHEGPDGIAARLTGLPGAGAVDLEIAGDGPIDDFSARIGLATEGTERLAGEVALSPGPTPADTAFRAALSGDPSALLAPEFRAFFGRDARLSLDGVRRGNGVTDINRLEVETGAVSLSGSAAMRAGGWPLRLRLAGRIANPDGSPVRLPLASPVTAARIDLDFDYDARTGDTWTGGVAMADLVLDGLGAGRVELDGTGRIFAGGGGRAPFVAGRVELAARGISAGDAAVAQALGETVEGRLRFDKVAKAPLALSAISLTGADFGLTGALSLDTDLTRLDLLAGGEIELRAGDMGRFAGLAGVPLSGGANLAIAGNLALPGGPFDLAITGTGTDLGLDDPRLDALFRGASTIDMAAVRDAEGTRIERFALVATGVRARGDADLRSGASRVAGRIEIPDGTLLAPGFSGAVSLDANGVQTGADWALDFEARAPGETQAQGSARIDTRARGTDWLAANLTGRIGQLSAYSGLIRRPARGGLDFDIRAKSDARGSDFSVTGDARGQDLGIGLSELDKLLRGASRLEFALRRADGLILLDRLEAETPQLSLSATAPADATESAVSFSGRLNDLGLLAPGLSGSVTAQGAARLAEGAWRVTGSASGPGGARVDVSGQVAADGTDPALQLAGRAPLALANGLIAPQRLDGLADFDLALVGGWGLTALTGSARVADARLALPSLRLALTEGTGGVRLAGGQATLDLAARASTGGRISVAGPVGMSAPFPADLTIGLSGVGVADPRLFDTEVDGRLTLAGPVTGGAMIGGDVTLNSVELRIPETGLGVIGALPGLRHLHEPASVRASRARAGLLAAERGGGGPPFGLDLSIAAPGRIFLRGRGLDAEFGGSVRLGGTTANVVAQGGFQLIRGRLDLLGNRLVITEGTVTLQGGLDPYLRVVAETMADDTQVRIIMEGNASAPDVRFTSAPDLPEDEILARLVFGRGIERISPFQALKLASAVATLAGQGGAGTVDRLRRGFGLDDLDVATDEAGNTALRAGAYIGENIYTDVTVGADGKAEINLNLTVTPNITARGRVSGAGNTGIGIYYEKDY